MSKKSIKIKIRKKVLLLFIVLVIIVALSLSLYFYLSKPLVYWNYKGTLLKFRTDLREAKKVYVYPNETSIGYLLWKSEPKNIIIVFKNTNDIKLTGVEAFEIAYKLQLAYLKENTNVKISAEEVKSFENLPHNSTFIALLPPSISNETSVKVKDNIIFISGKTQKEFDLAVVKFLIVFLGIEV